MIWYILGAVVIVGLILFFVLGKKKNKKEDETEGGQIDGSETTIIEPTVEDETSGGSDILPEELSAPEREKSIEE